MVDAEAVRKRLRITHTSIDDQLTNDISAAKAELKRVGISSTAVEASADPLIDKAIMAYCMWVESSNDKMAAGYEAMWDNWRDELRKTNEYRDLSDV